MFLCPLSLLTLEESPKKFLDAKIIRKTKPFQLRCLQSQQSLLFIGVPNSLLTINETLLPLSYIKSKNRKGL